MFGQILYNSNGLPAVLTDCNLMLITSNDVKLLQDD